MVFGFAGLSLDAQSQIKTDPHLPSHWRSLRFKVWHQGQQREIVVTGTG
jgi:trehalose/maltose hydrolase-like predicted phosphorylase